MFAADATRLEVQLIIFSLIPVNASFILVGSLFLNRSSPCWYIMSLISGVHISVRVAISIIGSSCIPSSFVSSFTLASHSFILPNISPGCVAVLGIIASLYILRVRGGVLRLYVSHSFCHATRPSSQSRIRSFASPAVKMHNRL